jgi:flavorubredoxin
LVHEVQHALGQPISVFINSAVIDGDESLLIDTGSLLNCQAWLKDAFHLVDPERIKWVFVSHEDADHVGNLDQVMEACRDANLVRSRRSPSDTPTPSIFPWDAVGGWTTG